jgi:hypothetical protein
VGRVAIEYLTELSEAAGPQAAIVGKVLHQWLDKIGGLCFVFFAEAVDFQIGLHERTNQVRPNCTLMVSLVPLLLRAGVSAFVTAVTRR